MTLGILALALLALALVVAIGCGGGGGDDGGSDTPSPASSLDPQTEAAAKGFLDRYVTPDGRVQRLDQGGDTVGEGQAYGMLVAVALGDEERFDAIWQWAKDNMMRPDGLLAFLWKDGRVQDPEAASDADVDVARALLVGSCRFKRPGLRDEAVDVGKAIIDKQTASLDGTPVLVAGPWARREPITLNPSYFSPATFAALQGETGDGTWGSLSASGRSVTGDLMQESTPLPPDWARVEDGEPAPIGSPGNPQATPMFGFDAARTLVRMAEDPDAAGREIAARAWPVFEGRRPADIPVEHDLTGQPIGTTRHPIVLVAAAGAADAAGDTRARDKLLNAAQSLDRGTPTYYGAAWVAIGRIMLTTDALASC
jgi:endoglucanase